MLWLDTGWVWEAHEHQVSDGRGLAWRRATSTPQSAAMRPICCSGSVCVPWKHGLYVHVGDRHFTSCPARRYRMKDTLITILTVGAVAAISATSSPAQAQYSQCIKGRGCVAASQRSYNACFNLALARGESAAWGERKSHNWFIYQCLAGKNPFDEPRRARR